MDVRRRRLRQLCQSYADATDQTDVSVWDVLHTAITRLQDLAAFTARRAAAGAEHVAAHVQHYLRLSRVPWNFGGGPLIVRPPPLDVPHLSALSSELSPARSRGH